MHYRFIYFLLFGCFSFSASGQGLYEQFQKAYGTKQYAACVQTGAVLVKHISHPYLQYQLAECYAAGGKTDSSLLLLKQLAAQGLPYVVETNPNFTSLYSNHEFASLKNIFKKNRVGIHQPNNVFSLQQRLLIPEGIASNKNGTEFYVGSYAKKLVVRKKGGKEEVFIPAGYEGLYGVLGIKLSPDEKELWVCSSSEQRGTEGYSGLFVFDVATRKLRRKIILEKKEEPHLLNDLAFDAEGQAYVTDSRVGRVWRVQDSTLQQVSNKSFIYPNGITYHPARNIFYVADYTGITILDPVNDSALALKSDSPVYLSGIDGLYFYQNSLVAVQNAGDDQYRIAEFSLSEDGKTVVGCRVLTGHHRSFEMPTTGTIVGSELYFISNSYVRHLQPDGKVKDAEKLRPTLIQKVPLR